LNARGQLRLEAEDVGTVLFVQELAALGSEVEAILYYALDERWLVVGVVTASWKLRQVSAEPVNSGRVTIFGAEPLVGMGRHLEVLALRDLNEVSFARVIGGFAEDPAQVDSRYVVAGGWPRTGTARRDEDSGAWARARIATLGGNAENIRANGVIRLVLRDKKWNRDEEEKNNAEAQFLRKRQRTASTSARCGYFGSAPIGREPCQSCSDSGSRSREVHNHGAS